MKQIFYISNLFVGLQPLSSKTSVWEAEMSGKEWKKNTKKVKQWVYNLHIFGKLIKFPVTTGVTVGGSSV